MATTTTPITTTWELGDNHLQPRILPVSVSGRTFQQAPGRSVKYPSTKLKCIGIIGILSDGDGRWSPQRWLTRGVEVGIFLWYMLFFLSQRRRFLANHRRSSCPPAVSYEHSRLSNHCKYMILTMLFMYIVKIMNTEEIKDRKISLKMKSIG